MNVATVRFKNCLLALIILSAGVFVGRSFAADKAPDGVLLRAIPAGKMKLAGGKIQLSLAPQEETPLTPLNVGNQLIDTFLKDRFAKWLLVIAGEPDSKTRVALFREAISWLDAEIAARRPNVVLASPLDVKKGVFQVTGSALLLEQEIDRLSKLQSDNKWLPRLFAQSPEAEYELRQAVHRARPRFDFLVEIKPLRAFSWMPALFENLFAEKDFYLLLRLVDRGKEGATLRSRIRKLSDQQVGQFTDALSASVIQFSQVAQVKISEFMESFRFTSPAQTRVAQLVLTTYFNESSTAQKLRYLARIIQDAPDLNDNGVRKAVLSASGPLLRKILQLFGRQPGLDRETAALATSFEDDDTRIPFDIFTASYAGTGILDKFRAIDPYPAAAGTMAQVHEAWISVDGALVKTALRDLKPGTEVLFADEQRIAGRIAEVLEQDSALKQYGEPSWRPVLENQILMVKREMDLELTAHNFLLAANEYNSKVTVKGNDGKRYSFTIRTPKAHLVEGHNKSIYVQEWSEGKRLDDVLKLVEHPAEVKSAIRNAVAQHFYSQALLGSRYVHGDLHMGNLRVTIVHEGPAPEFIIDLLDYGIFGQLKEATPRHLIRLFSGIELNQANLVIDELNGLQDELGRIPREKIEQVVTTVFNQPSASSGRLRGQLLFPRLVAANYLLPYEIAIFIRSHIALEVATYDPERKESLVSAFLNGVASDPRKIGKLVLEADGLGLIGTASKATLDKQVAKGWNVFSGWKKSCSDLLQRFPVSELTEGNSQK